MPFFGSQRWALWQKCLLLDHKKWHFWWQNQNCSILRTIFYSFLQNHILNTYFNQLHPSHRRDAYNKHPHWTAAFRNKIWYIWVWICLEFYEKARKNKNIGRYEMLTKKPIKWKKHSVSIFVLATTFGKTYPHLIWDFPQVTSVEKKETSKTFLSLGLRPRPQKLFSRYPFFYFG